MTKIEELEQRMDEIKTLQKDFEIEINECQKALAELKESKKKGKWLPNYGDTYWLRDTWGNFRTHEFLPGDDMKWRLNNVPLFKTEEQCKRYWHFMDTVKEKSYEFSKEEWRDTSIKKYFINYDSVDEEFDIDFYSYLKFIGTVYFKTEEDAQYIIDNFKDELMEYFV